MFNVATGLLATAPGGLVDITLISDDLGADSAAVSVFQVARLLTVIGLFPILVQHFFVRFKQEDVAREITEKASKTITMKWQDIVLTLGVAIVCSGMGDVSQIPVGTLIGSMTGCSTLNICFGWAKVPKVFRSGA